MEFSALELLKANSADPSKKTRLEEEAPFVPFVDYLKPAASDLPPREAPARAERESDRPEHPRRADDTPRRDPVHRPEAEETKHASKPADGKPADTPAAPDSEKISETDGKPTRENAATDAKPTGESTDNGNAKASSVNGEGVKAALAGVPVETANAASATNPAHPSTDPLLAALEKIEGKVTGKDGAPPPAAEVLSGILARKGAKIATGETPAPAINPGLATAKTALQPEGKADVATKGQSPFALANGENANGKFSLSSGQPQAMNTTQAGQMAQTAQPSQAVPVADVTLPTADFTAPAGTAHGAATPETPLGGLSPLSMGEAAATKAATLSTIQGRAPTPANAPPLTDQIAVHLKQAANDGMDRIRIQLKPASLGHIDVKMEIAKDGKVMAVLSIERPETFELLQRDARTLERALQDSGLRADSNSLNFQLRGQGNGQTSEDGQNTPAWGEDNIEEAEMPASEDYDYWTVGDGIVDIRV